MNDWLIENLVCPRHQEDLSFVGQNTFACPKGCRFPIVNDVPVMLLDNVRQTMELATTSLRQAREARPEDELYVESIGITEEEKRGILRLAAMNTTHCDPVVSFVIAATN